jgi:pyruvate/2-oxoglutarate dehydrogenase complex dihydrolipoamide acyltransferase (E2) component
MVPAPAAGTLKQTLKKEGDEVKVGEVLAVIE